jgi:uncharacterized membrane protein
MENQTSSSKNVGNTERGASIVAGSLLIYTGLRSGRWSGLGLALTGGALIKRGVTGQCALYKSLGIHTNSPDEQSHVSVPYGEGIRVDRAVTVNKPRFEVYSFWRNFENLPSFMNHLKKVRHTSEKVSHWVAKAPLGRSVEWDAEVINDIPGELIAWRSLPGADVANAGSVHFRDTAGNRGTEVKVELEYVPPGGAVGAFFAKLLGENPGHQIESDLRRFKMMLETGEIPTTLHEYYKSEEKKREKQDQEMDVHSASEGSFPASDAPAWT